MKVPEDPDNSMSHHMDTAAITDTDTLISFPIVRIVHISTRKDNFFLQNTNTITWDSMTEKSKNEQSYYAGPRMLKCVIHFSFRVFFDPGF
jgi:hypothetical protein